MNRNIKSSLLWILLIFLFSSCFKSAIVIPEMGVSDCTSSEIKQTIHIGSGHKITFNSGIAFKSATISDIDFDIRKEYHFKVASNSLGRVTYIEIIDRDIQNQAEVKKVMQYLRGFRFVENDKSVKEFCRKITIE